LRPARNAPVNFEPYIDILTVRVLGYSSDVFE
jgi:hypothetical protein